MESANLGEERDGGMRTTLNARKHVTGKRKKEQGARADRPWRTTLRTARRATRNAQRIVRDAGIRCVREART